MTAHSGALRAAEPELTKTKNTHKYTHTYKYEHQRDTFIKHHISEQFHPELYLSLGASVIVKS